MINWFLKAKSWQIFILFFGLRFLLHLVLMFTGSIAGDFNLTEDIITIVNTISLAALFAWGWSVAIGLQNHIPPEARLNVGRFEIFLIGPIFCAILDLFFIRNHPVNSIAPIFLIPTLCLFYCIYFIAKTYKSVDMQKRASFSDYIGIFFLIWLLPIGIWIIQPKINQMANK